MNTVDETRIREELARAVGVLNPIGPPIAALAARATRRRRNLQLVGGISALALAGAAALVIAVVITGTSGTTATIAPAHAPSAQSLTGFATSHGAVRNDKKSPVIGGPFDGSAGFYGAFAVKRGVQAAAWNGSDWRLDGPVITRIQPGQDVLKIAVGPKVNGPSLYVRLMGGDVSYFGYVLERRGSGWHPVDFQQGDDLAYGHPAKPGFVSVANNCKPYCAAGTQRREFWKWSRSKDRFRLVRTHKI